ncbi:MAG: AAA family ATPase [Nitrospirae bacterium RIFCSPLOWO2_02_FULL_62_14]|nr:MAG: AAA family ATPase [Nitrospirae bacterium RIFCSPLOWO2_02_FULL_62_14]
MSLSTSIHDLKTLILSSHPVVAIETVEEERVRSLLQAVSEQTKFPLFEWSITRGFARSEMSSEVNRTIASPSALLSHLEGLRPEIIVLLKDFSRHLDDATHARLFREVAGQFAKKRSTAVLAGDTVQLPNEIEALAVRYRLHMPDHEELAAVVSSVIGSIGKKAGGMELSSKDRDDLLRAMNGLTLNQARQAISHAILEDGALTPRAVQGVLDRKAQMIKEGGLLEYYPLADNRFELGGFANLKAWLQRAYLGFSPEARAMNLTPPRGILIVGVPGCGKSLACKVIARDWKLPLLKLDAGRLFDKFVGESEKNFRKAVAMAESMAPVVFWIDEIEKGMVSAGSGEADAGLGRRLFGAFLTWLQEKKQEVFVVATANDLSVLPPELLRKGRFDEIFFVDLPNEPEREAILKIQLGLRKQNPATFDLKTVVPACDGFSGAEIEQAIVSSLYRALSHKKPLDTGLLLEELRQTVPLSVSRREDITRLRDTAKGRFVSVR